MIQPSIPFMLCAILLTASCGNVVHDHSDHAHMHDTTATVQGHGADSGAVQLDNGNTWAANAETTQGIAAMQALLQGFDPATDDGIVLKEELEAEFKGIFDKCTMTGEAHEQLHNYLKPVHAMLESMGPDPKEADRQQMADYLGTYTKYFH